jgi:hypothetical protein
MTRRCLVPLLAILAAMLAGCGAYRWDRPGADRAAVEAELARCVSRENENSQRVNVPYQSRTRDGRTEILYIPDRFVETGFDRDTCMRAQGFVRVPDENSVWRPFTQAPRAP